MSDEAAKQHRLTAMEFDRRDRSWWTDLFAKALVFGGGVSAIVFIVGILVFIATQGLEFAANRLSWTEFFTSIAWRPNSQKPEYGALALIAGTVSTTAVAMILVVPLSLGSAIYIGEFARGKKREIGRAHV